MKIADISVIENSFFQYAYEGLTIQGELIKNYFIYNYSNCDLMRGIRTISDFQTVYFTYIMTHKQNIDRVIKTLTHDYSIFDNYNRTEETTTSGNSSSINTTENSTDTKRTTFNDTTAKLDNTVSENITSDTSGSSSTTITSNIRGNIGVTQNTDMGRNEILFRSEFNVIAYIVTNFTEKYCL